MKKVAEEEGFYEDSKAEYDALLSKVIPSKERDLEKFKEEIKTMLENEIVSRYYFQKGRAEDAFRTDQYIAKSIEILKQGYNLLSKSSQIAEIPLPQNDGLLRRLDCAVINMVHKFYSDENKSSFDSVRGLFLEGERVYDDAGFFKESHIQICVRNPNCIKGYFRVIEPDSNFPIP
jgi:hypothetical protein